MSAKEENQASKGMANVGCEGCRLTQGTQGNLPEKLKYLSRPQAGERVSCADLWGRALQA